MGTIIKTIRIKFDKLMGETPKAYLLKIMQVEHWVPKSQCRGFILNKKLGGNVAISAFIYERIFDTKIESIDDISYGNAEWVVEKHVPDRMQPVGSNYVPELKK